MRAHHPFGGAEQRGKEAGGSCTGNESGPLELGFMKP